MDTTTTSLNEWLMLQYLNLGAEDRFMDDALLYISETHPTFRNVMFQCRNGVGGAWAQLFAEVVTHSIRIADTEQLNPILEDVFRGRYMPLENNAPDPRLFEVNWLWARYMYSFTNMDEGLGFREAAAPRNGLEVEPLTEELLEGHSLPVFLLPLTTALRCNEPPQYGTLGQPTSCANLNEARRIARVFISHRWAQPGQPSAGNEWDLLKRFFGKLVQDTLLALAALVANGFPLSEWLGTIGAHGNNEQRQLILQRGITVCLSTEQRIRVDTRLAQTILLIAAEEILKKQQLEGNQWDATWSDSNVIDGILDQCSGPVFGRIFLWYDFCCLPQNLNEYHRSADEDTHFGRTLDLLPQVQATMDSFLIDVNDASYGQRGWCVAEWMNAAPNGCSQFRGNGYWPQAEIGWMDRPCGILRILLDPSLSSGNVLDRLGLEFTNDQHTSRYSDIICWILWNGVASTGLPPRWTDSFREGGLTVVGVGTVQDVIAWLELVAHAIGRRGNVQPLAYNRHEWQAARDRAFRAVSAFGSEEEEPRSVVGTLELHRDNLNTVHRLVESIESLIRGLQGEKDQEAFVRASIRVIGEERRGW